MLSACGYGLDDWVRQEVEEGLGHSIAVVIPVLVDGAHMPAKSDLPPSNQALSDLQAFPLPGDDLPQEVDALIEGIKQGRISPPRPAGAPAEATWLDEYTQIPANQNKAAGQ
jgi:hypothetical protein